jgi:hypothetical protein
MTRNEVNHLNMFNTVDAVFQQHTETINSMPALAESLVTFRDYLKLIRERDNAHSSIKAGAVATKNNSGEVATRLVKETMDALYTLGRKTGNEQLKAECDKTWSELSHLRQGTFLQLCTRIAGLARTYAADIAPFGISAADIDSLDRAITLFTAHVSTVQQKSAESVAAREALSTLFKKADDILKEDIDTMMDIVKSRDVEFYNQYKAARSIRNYGMHHTTKEEKPEVAPVALAA